MEDLENLTPDNTIEESPVVESAPISEVAEEKPEPKAKSFEEALERKIKDKDRHAQNKEEKAEEIKESPDDIAAKEAAKLDRKIAKANNLPPSWSKNLAEKWATLPDEVKLEIAKREEEVTRGFTRDGEDKKMAREFKDVFSEYEKQGIVFPRGYKDTVKELLGAAKVLNYGSPQEKLNYIDATARSVGIDLRSALGIGQSNPEVAQQNNLPNPELYALQQRQAQLEAEIRRQNELQDQMQSKEASEIINKFASDPAHKYYHQVAPQMGRLIQSGFASSLEDAYEKAINLDPDLSSMRIEEARLEAIAKFREKTTSQTNAAKKAAVSITGAAPTGSLRGSQGLSFEQALARNLGIN